MKALSFIHLASLDAVLVGLFWLIFLGKTLARFAKEDFYILWLNDFGNWLYAIIFACSIWLIYCLDRLFDCRKLNATAVRGAFNLDLHERHFFHLKHKKKLYLLSKVIFLLILLAMLLLVLIDFQSFRHLLVKLSPLIFAFFVYILFVHIAEIPNSVKIISQKFCLKEIASGSIFASATFLLADYLTNTNLSPKFLKIFIPLSVSCLFSLNCILVTFLEHKKCHDGDNREPTVNKSTSHFIALLVFCVLLTSSFSVLFLGKSIALQFTIVILCSSLLMLTIYFFYKSKKISSLQARIFLDWALILPILSFLK